ncbi:hypothetical protein KY465_18115 [Pseudohoeflea sp. DP4N28-3]|uniref:Septum formation initiator n=1 Tax=Pseudohoeflea coraliihabitans TaxID=2860393 RepID=A0ABS6WTB2_9HYPH|nr:hypothetical protein [Pseudohoeflea sp. DP4N28-3]
MLKLIPGAKWLPLIGGALLGAVAVSGPIWLIASHSGAVAERNRIEAKAARAALERIEEMEKNNAEFRNLPDRERCAAFMRDSGLPVSECDD